MDFRIYKKLIYKYIMLYLIYNYYKKREGKKEFYSLCNNLINIILLFM